MTKKNIEILPRLKVILTEIAIFILGFLTAFFLLRAGILNFIFL